MDRRTAPGASVEGHPQPRRSGRRRGWGRSHTGPRGRRRDAGARVVTGPPPVFTRTDLRLPPPPLLTPGAAPGARQRRPSRAPRRGLSVRAHPPPHLPGIVLNVPWTAPAPSVRTQDVQEQAMSSSPRKSPVCWMRCSPRLRALAPQRGGRPSPLFPPVPEPNAEAALRSTPSHFLNRRVPSRRSRPRPP